MKVISNMKKDVSIQIIRIIATVFIILCHLCNEFNNNYISLFGQFLNVGVFIFFFISGYLYGAKNIKNNKKWLASRLKTIIIPYYIFLFFLIIFNYIANGTFEYRSVFVYILNIQNFVNTSINGAGHLWFISVIMLCYCLLLILNKYKTIVLSKFSVISIISISIASFVGIFSKTYGLLGFYLYCFYLGYAFKNNNKMINVGCYKFAIMFIISIAVRIIFKKMIDNTLFYETAITAITHITIAICLFYIFYKILSDIKFKNHLFIKNVNFFDELSYYIFLTHYMFIVGPIRLISFTNIYVFNLLIYFIVTIFVAYTLKLIYKFILKVSCNFLVK